MDLEALISTLLTNRGLTSTSAISEFFNPTNPCDISLEKVSLSPVAINAAIQLIKQHISANSKIAVYGDYDVDGICSTAILWENIHRLTPHVFPHIPHRRDEGYGLSKIGIDHCLKQGAKLIITVDNGIVAHDQIAYAKNQGADVIIIDHHEIGKSLPIANAIIHSQTTCAAGLTWFFCREFLNSIKISPSLTKEVDVRGSSEKKLEEQLSLVSLAVVCDIIPLIGINRSLVKFGLEQLKDTKRPGLLALFELAKINPTNIEAYHLGFVIGPRINAMGRLEHALDSLRLICTTDPNRARELAQLLDSTNKNRQELTEASTQHAINQILTNYPQNLPKLLIVSDPTYDQGIIGLIAAKLVEKFYRPSIAINIGEIESKASARSISGFHITDHLRDSSSLFMGVGGHAMAAGFTVTTANLDLLKTQLMQSANQKIPDSLLVRQYKYDAEVQLSLLDLSLFTKLQQFAPFGLGNPQPTFLTKSVPMSQLRNIGAKGQHLRFMAGPHSAIWFHAPQGIASTPNLDIIYHLGIDSYQKNPTLQLIIKTSPQYANPQ